MDCINRTLCSNVTNILNSSGGENFSHGLCIPLSLIQHYVKVTYSTAVELIMEMSVAELFSEPACDGSKLYQSQTLTQERLEVTEHGLQGQRLNLLEKRKTGVPESQSVLMC